MSDREDKVSNSKNNQDYARNLNIAKEEYEVEKMILEEIADWIEDMNRKEENKLHKSSNESMSCEEISESSTNYIREEEETYMKRDELDRIEKRYKDIEDIDENKKMQEIDYLVDQAITLMRRLVEVAKIRRPQKIRLKNQNMSIKRALKETRRKRRTGLLNKRKAKLGKRKK